MHSDTDFNVIVGIKEAAKATGLSEWELRQGVRTGKYPAFRVGGKRGKILFNIQLLEERIQQLMKGNLADIEEIIPGYYKEFRIRG